MQKQILTAGLTAGLVMSVILGTGCTTPGTKSCCGTCQPAAACSAFTTSVDEEGRLWILKAGEEKAEKHITMVGAGPGGATVKALSKDTVLEYLAQKPGFTTAVEDGRLWVFKAGETMEMPEKHITMIGAGPLGSTLKAIDRETAVTYLASKPGFKVAVEDDRLWVYKADEDAAMPEKHVTLVGAGPQGMTIKATDRATAIQYLASKPGFSVQEDEHGRLWVFQGAALDELPEKHVTRVGAGPLGKTLKAVDRDTMAAYLAAR
jgi:hypothetical protein